MSRFRQLEVSFLRRRHRFVLSALHIGFVVDKLDLTQEFFKVFRFFAANHNSTNEPTRLSSLLRFAIGPISQHVITVPVLIWGFKFDPALIWVQSKETGF